jgi:HK97 family phage portal protein
MAPWLRLLLGGRERKYDTLDLFREVFGHAPTWAGKSVTLQTAMQISAALACGRVISESIAMLPWKLLRRAGKEIGPAIDEPIYDLLAIAPNPLQTAFEFQEQIGLHLAFCGNAYVWMPRVRGRVDALYPFEPAWTTVKYQWPERPSYLVRSPDGTVKMALPADQVWHLRGPSWTSYTGLKFLELARQSLGLSMAIEEGQARLQAEGVRMPGYISVDGTLTEAQYKALRDWLDKEHSGSANAGRAMILDRAAKWVETSMTNEDGQVLEQRKFAVEEVCRFMRVLPIMVGHADKTATYASAEQMFLAHAIYTLGPWARRLELSADRWLLTREQRQAGLYTKLNEKALQRMTATDQMGYLARGVLTGIYTRNEARGKLDENPLPGLDEPLAPANTFVGNPPEPQPAPAAPPKADEED